MIYIHKSQPPPLAFPTSHLTRPENLISLRNKQVVLKSLPTIREISLTTLLIYKCNDTPELSELARDWHLALLPIQDQFFSSPTGLA